MENPKFKKTQQQLIRHIERTHNCRNTKTFVYKQKSFNTFEIKKCPHRCHSYFCQSCAEIIQLKIRKKVKKFTLEKNLRFMTLTLTTEFYSPEKSIDEISKHFEMLVKLLKYRRYKFQYFKIIELTKKNIAHIHCLISAYLPENLVSELWYQITKSYIVKIKAIPNNQKAVEYVTKYISKSIDYVANAFFFLLHKRRYSYSKNFFLPQEKPEKFTLSGFTFYDDKDFLHTVDKYFYLKFQNYELIKYVFLN